MSGEGASAISGVLLDSTFVETSLYRPVKNFLEGLGFAVKGEVGGCDIVALRGDEPPMLVICELKLRFSLDLLLQGVDRATACDEVWLAVRGSVRRGRERDPRVRKLCRRLGFGLLAVSSRGLVEILAEPTPYRPRPDRERRRRLAEEHRRRQGDPTPGGSSRAPIMTAYRQEALACAAALCDGPLSTRVLRQTSAYAPRILLDNVYGWFERVERGVYRLNEAGRAALLRFAPPPEPAKQRRGAAAGEPEAAPA